MNAYKVSTKPTEQEGIVENELCYELVWNSKPLRQCTNPAKYRYDAGRGRVEHLCGVHAKVYKGSENLSLLTEEDAQ